MVFRIAESHTSDLTMLGLECFNLNRLQYRLCLYQHQVTNLLEMKLLLLADQELGSSCGLEIFLVHLFYLAAERRGRVWVIFDVRKY